MKIYTKGGDTGQTGLFGGERVSKDHLRVQVYGGFDELNATLGVVVAESGADPKLKDLKVRLLRVQAEIFQLGAELATPRGKKTGTKLLETGHIQALETEIDEMEAKLAPLKNFVLPGGSTVSAVLHLARTVCRRAERELVVLDRAEPVRPEVLQYVNRLSDYLFVSARAANHQVGLSDTPWNPPK